MPFPTRFLVTTLAFIICCPPLWADDSLFDDTHFLNIATGYRQKLTEAPAVGNVITAAEIKKRGLSSLEQAIESVAGLHVSRSAIAYKPIYIMRGIYSEENQSMLMMVDGMPITHLYFSKGGSWSNIPVESIARIEIIRGPGSALYGADALSGVINIITKQHDDGGNEVGVRYGSFNSTSIWLSQSISRGALNGRFTAELGKTDGLDGIVDADTQTIFDDIFATSASLAPGSVNTRGEYVDINANLNYGTWEFKTRYEGRFDVGTGAGHSGALDPTGEQNAYRMSVSMNKKVQNLFGSNWDLNAHLDHLRIAEKFDLMLFPEEAVVLFRNTPQFYPEGVIGQPSYWERHYRGYLSASYFANKAHRIRIDAGINMGEIYKVEEKKNFDSNGVPFGEVVDVSNDSSQVYLEPDTRNLRYLLVQDEWTLSPDWVITSGLRYDDYSDFGESLNPRLALVWSTNDILTSKLLYGRAFRAPSFAERYLINNPVLIGDPELDAEIINTYELAFHLRFSEALKVDANVFYYRLTDRIYTTPTNSEGTRNIVNGDRQTGRGAEFALSWAATPALEISSNYAYQRSEDRTTGTVSGNAPEHQFYLDTVWNFTSRWQLSSQVNWVGRRKRPSGDVRAAVDDYTTMDLALRYGSRLDGWSLGLSVQNLFDEDAREPWSDAIANDLPTLERTIAAEFRLHLD